MDKLIQSKETTEHILHKGHIYWRLGLEYLVSHDLAKSIEFLRKSSEEDKRRGDTFSASQGLTQVLVPLANDVKAVALYQSLSDEEKDEFANNIILTHDQLVSRQVVQIKDNFFTFISDPVMQEIVFSTYKEVFITVTQVRNETFYSCVFALGSILEGMIEDLLERDSERVWKKFVSIPNIENDGEAKELLKRIPRMLGPKIEVLRIMSSYGVEPVSKVAILQMELLHRYRNLIHPKVRKDFEFKVNWYIAATLFTFISHIASHWWPVNVEKRIGG